MWPQKIRNFGRGVRWGSVVVAKNQGLTSTLHATASKFRGSYQWLLWSHVRENLEE